MRLFQEYLSIQEIADAVVRFNLSRLPRSARRVLELAEREGWTVSPLCRKRGGVEGGGGNEYHYTLLPLALQTALLAEHARGQQLVAVGESQAREVMIKDKLALSDLSARQRGVMEARAGVLREVEGRMLRDGVSQRRAILGFLADLAAGRLNEMQRMLAEKANDKGRGSFKRDGGAVVCGAGVGRAGGTGTEEDAGSGSGAGVDEGFFDILSPAAKAEREPCL